jgi:hypothetical protein
MFTALTYCTRTRQKSHAVNTYLTVLKQKYSFQPQTKNKSDFLITWCIYIILYQPIVYSFLATFQPRLLPISVYSWLENIGLGAVMWLETYFGLMYKQKSSNSSNNQNTTVKICPCKKRTSFAKHCHRMSCSLLSYNQNNYRYSIVNK